MDANTAHMNPQNETTSDLLQWQLKAIEEGIKDEAEGNLISHEEVMRKWGKWLEDQMDQSSRK